MVWGWELASRCERLTLMKNTINASQPRETKENIVQNSSPETKKADEQKDTIYLGIDQHADTLVVAQQYNACVPKRARKFTKKTTFMKWVSQMIEEGASINACYEAGPCGYWLYRELREMGVMCIVVAPKKWSENGKVKTDARDALILCDRLFQWEQGRKNAFTTVRVPTLQEEHDRGISRNRERLLKERKRLAQSGRGIGLLYQLRLKGQWWKGKKWDEDASQIEELLGPIRAVLLEVERQIEILTKKLEAQACEPTLRPAGLGELTDAVIAAEVCDFNRFNNRREPGAYVGLSPGESTSGGRRKGLPITKTGSGMLRRYLTEAVWRLIRFQPNWHAWKRWEQRFAGAPKWRRKQIVVALSRQLLIDLWRLRTKQTTMETLGWEAAR